MKIVKPEVLALFRAPGRCELCKKHCPAGREPDHYFFARGMGGGSQLDHPYNLVAVCRECHDRRHYAAEPTRYDILNFVVAPREGVDGLVIEAELHRLRSLPKGSVA